MRHFIKLERPVIDIGILIRIRMLMRNRGSSNQSRMQFLIMLVEISFFFIDWLCMITVMIIFLVIMVYWSVFLDCNRYLLLKRLGWRWKVSLGWFRMVACNFLML